MLREDVQLRREIGKTYRFDNIIGKSKAMQNIFDLIQGQKSLEELEQEYITRILEQTEGAKFRVAQFLGIDRKTLYLKLEQYKDNSLPSN